MAAENYWRYADARQQQQQAMAAAAAGMAPPQTVNPAQSVAAVAGMNPQAAAMAQQAAAPPLKRARPDYGDVSAGQDMTGYYPRETDRAGYHSLRENEAIGASYDRYLRNGMPSVGANDTGRPVVGGMVGGMGAGMAGYPVDERRMMGVVGMDARGMGYGARPEPPLPPDASNTLYIEGLPANCTRREVSHIFRPFVGFREVRLVNKESRHPGGDPHVLCFVDFDNPTQATIALEALQGSVADYVASEAYALTKLPLSQVVTRRGHMNTEERNMAEAATRVNAAAGVALSGAMALCFFAIAVARTIRGNG